MASGKKTDPVIATAILALGDSGVSGAQIADNFRMPRTTVYQILRGEDNYVRGPVLVQARAEVKELLQARSLDLAYRAQDQIELALPEAGAKDAAIVMGILRDHERLDAGEATANIEIHHKVEVEALEDLGDRLAKSLLRKAKGLQP